MKRKKKNSTNKQSKQENRHQQNEFYKKMKQMVVKLGDTQTLHFLDAYSPDQLLHIHLRPYKIINPDDGQLKVSQKNLWVLNKELNEMLHRTIINIGKQQLPVCLYDFRIYVQPLYWLWQ